MSAPAGIRTAPAPLQTLLRVTRRARPDGTRAMRLHLSAGDAGPLCGRPGAASAASRRVGWRYGGTARIRCPRCERIAQYLPAEVLPD